MPIFAIMPSGERDVPTVWVDAETEREARRLVSMNVESHSEAADETEFECVRDDRQSPPPGVILSDGGITHTVKRR